MKIKNIFRFLSIRILKARALAQETTKIENCISWETLSKNKRHNLDPFEYIVIDNFFSDEVYAGICKYVQSVKDRGISESPSNNRFYPFKYVTGWFEKYGGYFYAPHYQEDSFMDIFFSARWNLFVEKLMQKTTNEFISTTIHWHTPGNNNGGVHSDYQKAFFNKKDAITNGMIVKRSEGRDCLVEAVQSIAIIYYFDNDSWKSGDGGETAIFSSPNEQPYALIEPLSNRLLILKVSPKSFHAFMGNKNSRHAIVQWFHVDTHEAVHEYGYI